MTGRYVKRHLRKAWPKADEEELLRRRDEEHQSFPEIDAAMGRTPRSCRAKYHQLKADPNPRRGMPEPGMRVAVTPAALADRDARYRLRMLQPAAAAIMGDPLPGRSALDQKRGVEQ